MPEEPTAYLDILNPEQREAVLHTGNPLLILAGAGSGKTRVITTKVAYLIREQGLDPRSILAVTFTNKAAREMAGRAQLIDSRAEGAMLRTFHSFGAWFLRRNGALAGLDSGFVIYDDEDAVSLLSSLLEDVPRAEVKTWAWQISRAKDMFLSPDDPRLGLISSHREFPAVYRAYEEKLAKMGNVDFGDLIKKPVEILREHPEAARRIRDRFRVIMVDEYQDANIAQAELLKELWEEGNYLCVVGDDDQSIYRFRGADVGNILQFPSLFPNVDIIRLERNYRSTNRILQAASSVVGRNRGRLGKSLRSQRGEGKTPVAAFLPDQDEEAAFCAELIEGSIKKKKAAGRRGYADWAVLYRTNAQSMVFENEFVRRGIPYRVVGSLKFYEREEIKDALALLSFMVNPRDEVAFRRVVNKPSRGLGPATVGQIIAEAEAAAEAGGGAGAWEKTLDGEGLAGAARRIGHTLSPKARAGLKEFLEAIDAGKRVLGGESGVGNRESNLRLPTPDSRLPTPDSRLPTPPTIQGGTGLSLCLAAVLEASGIAEYHRSRDDVSGAQRLSNLQELANAASAYPGTREGLLEFLEHIELDRAVEDDPAKGSTDVVTLITLHNTKGLEFPKVIITGVERGIFPRADKKGDDLEEERRLFYVGATRAMDELYLCCCAWRRVFGRLSPMEPSVFLQEIDPRYIRMIGDVPRGFKASSYDDEHPLEGPRPGPGIPARQVSSDGRWAVGDRLFHDDRGYGAVAAIEEGEDGPVIKARFDSGFEARFLSGSKSFMKISED